MCGSLRSDESVPTLSVSYTNKWNGNQTSKACFAVLPECYWVAVFSIEDNNNLDGKACSSGENAQSKRFEGYILVH